MTTNDGNCQDRGCASCMVLIHSSWVRGEAHTERASNLPEGTQLSSAGPARRTLGGTQAEAALGGQPGEWKEVGETGGQASVTKWLSGWAVRGSHLGSFPQYRHLAATPRGSGWVTGEQSGGGVEGSHLTCTAGGTFMCVYTWVISTQMEV